VRRRAVQAGDMDTGRFLRLERFDQWYLPGKPYPRRRELRMPVTQLTQRFQLERGEVDYMREFHAPGRALFPHAPGVVESTDRSDRALDVRRAAQYADEAFRRRAREAGRGRRRQSPLSAVFRGAEQSDGASHPAGVPGNDPRTKGQRFDSPRARALMAEAGITYDPKTGLGGYPETIQYFGGESEGPFGMLSCCSTISRRSA